MEKVLDFLLLPLKNLSGFGEKTIKLYEKLLSKKSLELNNELKVVDLLYHKPERVLFRQKDPNLMQVQDGDFITTKVIVSSHEIPYKKNQPHRIICYNETGFITIIYYKMFDFMNKIFHEGNQITVSGKVEKFNNELQMSHPDYINSANIPDFEQIYPLTAGLTNKSLHQTIQKILSKIPDLPEWIPDSFLFEKGWQSWKKSIFGIHNAKNDSELSNTSLNIERLAFDELLANQIVLNITKEKIKSENKKNILDNKTNFLKEKILKVLPFSLTNDQQKVITEIEKDIYSEKRMLRLLQGDVGSGKTVVAFLSMLPFLENNKQVAFMVPTSILAIQHFEWIKNICNKSDFIEVVDFNDDKDTSSSFITKNITTSILTKNVLTPPLDNNTLTSIHVKDILTPPPVKGGKGGFISPKEDLIPTKKLHSLPYNPLLKEKARELRQNQTPYERIFWTKILALKQFEMLKWTRQKPIDNFIIDFFCSKLMLGVEIDGNTHDDRIKYDKNRSEILEKQYGIQIIRYTNDDVKNNIEGVYEDLRLAIEKRRQYIEKGRGDGVVGCCCGDYYENKTPLTYIGVQQHTKISGDYCENKTPLTPLIRGESEDILIRGERDDVLSGEDVKMSSVGGGYNNILNGGGLAISGMEKDIRKKKKIRIALLTGNIKGKKRTRILKALKDGNIDILVGTHALFQENVEFKDLGYAVIDEQHRFGVVQRLSLIEKGKDVDILVMTATPIPRTLALTIYGDMEVSTIKEKPKNRKEIITTSLQKEKFYDLVIRMKEKIKDGEKVYWICPLIDESENLKATPLFERYEQLKMFFQEEELGFLHGKMSETEKDKIMNDFSNKDGLTKILISTTVVEVGVDVPDATIIIIESPERFGLSQMHQLRGRVGRGSKQSYCILFYEKLTDNLRKRMETLKKSSDGFFIAEEDLKLRGAGEMLGARQSGYQEYMIADLLNHYNLLLEASKLAKYIVQNKQFLNSEAVNILLKLFGYNEIMDRTIFN